MPPFRAVNHSQQSVWFHINTKRAQVYGENYWNSNRTRGYLRDAIRSRYTWNMSQTPRLHTILPVLLLHLVFLGLLPQTYQSTLSAAQNAPGWFSPTCDGASFY